MQFPIQPAGGYFPNQPVSRPYPGGAYPQPQIYPQQIGYGMPPSYPAQNSPPFISAPSVMGGQFRGPQMHPYQPQPLLIGNRPMAMGFPQPYRPIHPQQAPLSRPSAANTKIQEDKIHCVICGGDFLVSEKEQHARRHARPKAQEGSGIKKLVRQYKQQYQGPKLRPIVQPEQYNVQYNPNQFLVQQTVNYQTVAQKRIPPQVKQTSTSTSEFPGNKSISIANPQLPVQNSQSNQAQSMQQPQQIAFQPETVRLTNDGQQIMHNPGNIYDAAAERRFRESQLSANQQKEPSVVNNSDARFDRGTFISDQPVPAVQPQGNLSYRQTISPINPQMSVSNQPRMVSSRQPPNSSISQPQPIQTTISAQPIENRATTQPLQVNTPQPNINQKVQLDQDSEGVKAPYRSSYDRKYDPNDYARKTQTDNYSSQVQPQPAVPIVSPYNSQVNTNQNMDLARASSYNQNNPTSIANNSVADSLAENQRLQSSKPPALQSLENIPRQTNNSNIIDDFEYGRSPDDKIIPRQTRNQQPSQLSQPSSSVQPSQSVDHEYFPFKQDNSLPPANSNIAPVNTSSYTSPRADTVTQPRMTNNVQPVQNAEQIRMSEILKQKDPKYETAGYEQPKAPSQNVPVQNIPAQNQNTLDPYRSNTSYKPVESVQPPQKEYQSAYPSGFQQPDRQTNTQPNPTISSNSQSLQQPSQTIQQPVRQTIQQSRQTIQQPVRQTIQQPARQTVQQPSYPQPKFQESFNQSIQPAQPSNQSLQQSYQSVQDPFKEPYREPSQQIQSPSTDINRLANNSATSQRIGADVSLTQNYQPNNPLQILQPTTTQVTTTRKKLPRFVGTEW